MFPRAWRDAPMTFNHVMQLVRTLVVVLTMRFGYTSVHMQAARCTNDQRHWSTWGEYMLDPVTVVGETPFFSSPPVTPGFWWELDLWTYTRKAWATSCKMYQ